MADHILEASLSFTTSGAARAIASIVPAALGAGVRPPEIREIGISNGTAVAAEIGLGFPAALGTGSITTSENVQDITGFGTAAGNTKLVTAYATTQPTAPGSFSRRFQIQGVIGAGVIWTWGPGEWPLWAGATVNAPVVWQISATTNIWDVYIKVAE